MSDLSDYLAAGQVSFSRRLFDGFADSNLTPAELLAYLFLSTAVQTGETEPDLTALAQRAKMRPSDYATALGNLSAKGAIAIHTRQDAAGRMHDQYDVTPLLKQLLPQGAVSETPSQPNAQSDMRTVFTQIETEFGRPLSPIEQQTIRAWLREDHYAPDMIALALREAVLNQAYSLKYMDRILISWEKNHLTTPAAVRAAQQRLDGL